MSLSLLSFCFATSKLLHVGLLCRYAGDKLFGCVQWHSERSWKGWITPGGS